MLVQTYKGIRNRMKKLLISLFVACLFFISGVAHAEIVSNASLLDLDCTAVELADGWTDGDTGNAESKADTNVPVADAVETAWVFDSNTAAANAIRNHASIGSVDGLGTNPVISIRLYCDAIGAVATFDRFQFALRFSDLIFQVAVASDGLFLWDGAAYVEAGTDIVVQDTWQEWTFRIDKSGGAASATCDVYLEDVLQEAGVDCSWSGGPWTDGEMNIIQYGGVTSNRITYIDWLKIGHGFSWSGNVGGITSIGKIGGIAVGSIGKVGGIE